MENLEHTNTTEPQEQGSSGPFVEETPVEETERVTHFFSNSSF